jgi:hypothetical protein
MLVSRRTKSVFAAAASVRYHIKRRDLLFSAFGVLGCRLGAGRYPALAPFHVSQKADCEKQEDRACHGDCHAAQVNAADLAEAEKVATKVAAHKRAGNAQQDG